MKLVFKKSNTKNLKTLSKPAQPSAANSAKLLTTLGQSSNQIEKIPDATQVGLLGFDFV